MPPQSLQWDCRLLGPQNEPDLLALVSQRPIAYNDFASVIVSPSDGQQLWGVFAQNELKAAAIDSGIAVALAGDPAGLAALGLSANHLAQRFIVSGRRDEVEAFLGEHSQSRKGRPEYLMLLEKKHHVESTADVELRVANASDLAALHECRIRAVEEEFKFTIDRQSAFCRGLLDSVEEAVVKGAVAVWVVDDHLVFTAKLSSRTDVVAMFGDLYLVPAFRGQGLATHALRAFCSWLLRDSNAISLRVGIDNLPAIQLYERCGFEKIDDFLASHQHPPRLIA